METKIRITTTTEFGSVVIFYSPLCHPLIMAGTIAKIVDQNLTIRSIDIVREPDVEMAVTE